MKEFNEKQKKFLISKLSKYTSLKDSKALEVGCGSGRIADLIGKEFGSYLGMEVKPGIIPQDFDNVHFKEGKFENTIFRNKFDVVLFIFSWHYSNNYDETFNKVDSVLSEKGVILILEPSESTQKWISPEFRKESPEFNENLFNRKISSIKRGENFLEKQKRFIVLESKYFEDTGLKLWLLGRI